MSTAARTIVLFEDPTVANLGPLVALRPAFELRVGALNLRERLELCHGVHRLLSETRSGGGDDLLEGASTAERDVWRVNARLCGPVEAIDSALDGLEPGDALVRGQDTLMVRGTMSRKVEAPEVLKLIDWPWDIVRINDELLVADAGTLQERGGPTRRIHAVQFIAGSSRPELLAEQSFELGPSVQSRSTWIGPEAILLGRGVDIRPAAVIDASAGPVILGAGVVVHPLAVVTGPAYLGPGTVVNPGAKLREGTSAGAFCKLGGEIEESVILDLSNKQHDGFLGHAVLGSWVNLGADTNGSDLKNNYSNVKVDLGDGPVDTGQGFVGQLIGDHAKTGIATMLTTGGVVGVAANVFGAGFIPRLAPAFSWGGAGGLVEYRLEEALGTARTVYARRDVRWTDNVEKALRQHFADTAELRRRVLAP